MNKINAIIPMAIQINLDDVAWHEGEDKRHLGQASRSGIPRRHEVEDYQVLEAIGARLGMKILCPLVLGDWDKDNVLRGFVGATHDPYGWDRKNEINYEVFEEARDILDRSEYIELVIHGLLHGVYGEDGKLIHEMEYFKMIEEGGEEKMVISSDDDFNKRIRLFFEIYNGWGFTKKIRSFVSPCGFANSDECMIADLAKKLEALGIKYWANGGFSFKGPLGVYSDIAVMKKGGSYNGKYGPMPPWEGYDLDPDLLMPFVDVRNHGGTNMVGMHWTNLLRLNPKRDFDYLPEWINYFNRERETFGTMIAKDVEFSVTQQFYSLYSKVNICEGKCIIDVSEACAKKTKPCKDEFYISFTKDISPKFCLGGEISLYEEHKKFNTYKVVHIAKQLEILL